MSTRYVFSLTSGAMILAANAMGGPPLLTDDPGTSRPNHWEINVAMASEKSGAKPRHEN